MAELWTSGTFNKDIDKDDVGQASISWEVDGTVVYTYTERVNGVQDKNIFKQNAIESKDKFLLDKARNELLGNTLTNYMNQ
jgi:hypothetical protein